MNSVTARKRLIAHALVTDAAGRVLLCETSFKADFELPGGIIEAFESPAVGAARMVEEMGWAPALTGVLVVDWLRPYLGWEDALELVFDTVPVSDAEAARLVPDGHEILALHWVPVSGPGRGHDAVRRRPRPLGAPDARRGPRSTPRVASRPGARSPDRRPRGSEQG